VNDTIRAEWARRVVAEYRSCAATQELVLWLTQIGASPDLIRMGMRVAEDELGHAEGSAEVLAAAGGRIEGVLDRRLLSLPATEPREAGVVRATVELFCLGETVAVPLFRRMLAGAEEPAVRRLLVRILRDEARHRAFGWTLLGALMEGPTREVARQCLAVELPAMLGGVIQAYDGQDPAIGGEERRWGLIAPAEYAAELRWTWRRWYRPRFAALGVGIPDR
jgi:1,2-phenylacetyl-CoA epoxidase catalytic subunit